MISVFQCGGGTPRTARPRRACRRRPPSRPSPSRSPFSINLTTGTNSSAYQRPAASARSRQRPSANISRAAQASTISASHGYCSGSLRTSARRPGRPHRDALQEQLAQLAGGEVGAGPYVVGLDDRAHQPHIGLDLGQAECAVHRHPVVPVADEVDVADLVDVDRRQRLAPSHRLVDPLEPPPAQPGARPELRVELAYPVHRADDLLHRDHLHAEGDLVDEAERVDDLLERQRVAVAALLAQQAGGQRRDDLQAAGAEEVGLGVGPGGAGVTDHRRSSSGAKVSTSGISNMR